jgi:hypothetical protein
VLLILHTFIITFNFLGQMIWDASVMLLGTSWKNTLGNLRNTDKHNWEHQNPKKMIELHMAHPRPLKKEKKDGPLRSACWAISLVGWKLYDWNPFLSPFFWPVLISLLKKKKKKKKEEEAWAT